MNCEEYKRELIIATSAVYNACPVLEDNGIEMEMPYKEFIINQTVKAKLCLDIFGKLNGSTVPQVDSINNLISALFHLAKANKIDVFELLIFCGDEYLSDLASIGRRE